MKEEMVRQNIGGGGVLVVPWLYLHAAWRAAAAAAAPADFAHSCGSVRLFIISVVSLGGLRHRVKKALMHIYICAFIPNDAIHTYNRAHIPTQLHPPIIRS